MPEWLQKCDTIYEILTTMTHKKFSVGTQLFLSKHFEMFVCVYF